MNNYPGKAKYTPRPHMVHPEVYRAFCERHGLRDNKRARKRFDLIALGHGSKATGEELASYFASLPSTAEGWATYLQQKRAQE